jgi:SAM-dependent methyltransferase
MSAQHSKLAATYDAAYQHQDFLNHLDGLWQNVGDTPVRTVSRLASRNFSKDAPLRLADLGCGTGRDLIVFSKLLSESGFAKAQLMGCEISPVAVEKCRARGLSVECSDAESFLGRAANPFSIIWSHFSFIHLTDAEIGPVVSILADKVASRGILGVGFKAGDGQRLKDPPDKTCNVERETTYFRYDMIANLIQQNGLEIQASISVPSSGTPVPHQYAWIIASKL